MCKYKGEFKAGDSMDISLYHEFVTLASHRNYSAAARDLNMSQPTLSRHMNALSKELKCQLFYDTRPLTLTVAGEQTLRFASKIISDEQNLRASLHKLKSTKNPRIRILNLLHVNTLYIGINEIIPDAKDHFADLRFEFVNMDHFGLNAAQMVEMEKVDVSFDMCIRPEGDFTPPEYPDSIRAIPIPEFYGELVLGVSKNSKYAEAESFSLDDLKPFHFIMEADMYGDNFRKDFIDICGTRGFYPDISLIPATDHLEFFSSDPGDSMHLLSRVDREYRPLLAGVIKQHTVAKEIKADTRYFTHAYALVNEYDDREEMRYFVDKLEEHAEEVMKRKKMRPCDRND